MSIHEHRHPDDDTAPPAALAELLDLDGVVLASYLHDATAWVGGFAPADTRRVLDLGCGTGTATIALARQFADAEFIALDASEDMLTSVRARAREHGLTGRVRTVAADLDHGWPAVGHVDLVWASMSLHHLADPDRVLRDVFAAVGAGGRLAVAEMNDQVRFLPDDIGRGRPGLEARIDAVRAARHAEQVPNLGRDWRPFLERAGFRVEAEREFVIDLRPPLTADARRYARTALQRTRSHVGDELAPDDLATLDLLLDPDRSDGLLHRADLRVRARRTVHIARWP